MTVGNVVDSNIPMSGKAMAPIDPTENAMKAYSLAGTMVDTQEKIRKRDEGQFDRQVMQDFLKNGGDLATPEGTNKALNELKGKVSPDLYENLIKHKDAIDEHTIKQKSQIMALRQDSLEDMSKQDEALAPMLDKFQQQYAATASTRGQQAADAEFEANRGQLVQWMQSQQIAGQPRFTPDVLKNIQTLDPSHLGQTQAAVKYHSTLVKDRLEEARSEALLGAGDLYRDSKGGVYKINKISGSTMKQNDMGVWEPSALPPDAKPAGKVAAGGNIEYSPEAMKNVATNHLLTGVWPSRMTADQKAATANEEAKIAKFMGLSSVDMALLPTQQKAKQKAFVNLENLAGSVGAFEKNMGNYAERSLENLRDIDTTSVPLLNKWVQSGMGATSGLPPPIAKLAVNLRALASEYAKLSSGSLGNTQLGEKALMDVQKMFSTADNPESLKATISEVLKDASFRTEGIKSQQAEIMGSMRGLGSKADAYTPGSTKVPPAAQAAADSDRQSILRDELKKSTDALNAAKTPDEKRRIQDDIRALRAELGGNAPPEDDKSSFDAKTQELLKKYGAKK